MSDNPLSLWQQQQAQRWASLAHWLRTWHREPTLTMSWAWLRRRDAPPPKPRDDVASYWKRKPKKREAAT